MNTKKLAIIISLTVLLLLGVVGIKFSGIGQQQDGGLGTVEAAGDLNLELSIKEPNGVNRVNESITSGIPLPKSLNITNDQILQIVDANGNPVPAQFRTTVRWNGLVTDITKPIKWVLVDFQASVPANGEATYYLEDGGFGNAANGLDIVENIDKLIVLTGVAEFTINKNGFNLFDIVNLNGKEIVSSLPENGIVITGIDEKRLYSSLDKLATVEIEEQGPLRSVIKVHGWHQAQDSSQLLEYTARLHFYKDKSYAKVFYTLENNEAFGVGDKHFEDLTLTITLNLQDAKTVTYGKGAPEWWINEGLSQGAYQDTFTGQQTYYLYQDHQWRNNLDQSKNFQYKIYKGGKPQPQGTWTKMNPTGDGFLKGCDFLTPDATCNSALDDGTPMGRVWFPMTFDTKRNKIVMFGGGGPYSTYYMNDLWSYDLAQNKWHLIQPMVYTPSDPGWITGRDNHMMVYDDYNDLYWVFGGTGRYAQPDDPPDYDNNRWGGTWSYDPNQNKWSRVSMFDTVFDSGFAYAPDAKKIVSYGGIRGFYLDETWVFDVVSKTWTQVHPELNGDIPKPFGQNENAMVYDTKHKKFIFFGGEYPMSTAHNETWVYDLEQNRWTQMHPENNGNVPPSRYQHAMVYDSNQNVIILYGGMAGQTVFEDTWVYDYENDKWSQINTESSPGARRLHAMTYDPYNKEVVLFGNGSNTWTFKYEPQDSIPTEVDSGIRTSGWVDLGDVEQGLTVAVRDFWQNFPKGMEVDGNKVNVGLWTKEGNGPEFSGDNNALEYYRFEGGRHKTYEMLYYFHSGDVISSQSENQVKSFNSPLFTFAPPDWYAQSGALGFPYVEKKDWNNPNNNVDPILQDEFKRYEKFQGVKWNINDTTGDGLRTTLYGYFERGGTYGGEQNYGWYNYGDITWDDGYCSVHYDWPFNMLLQFLRTGDRPFLDLGSAMTKHRTDIDQYHTDKDISDGGIRNRGQQYEKGDFHGLPYYAPEASHTWIEGPLLYYSLTGDKRSMETALEGAKFYDNYWKGNYQWNGVYGVRIPGWTIYGLAQLYQYTGESIYLSKAKSLIDSVIAVEQSYGGKGYVLNPADDYKAYPWLEAIMANGVMEYLEAKKQRGEDDKEAKDYLIRQADWFLRRGNEGPLRGGAGADISYYPYYLVYWNPDNPSDTDHADILHGLWIADPLAYAYTLTQNDTYRTMARNLFSDAVNYWGRVSYKIYEPVDKNNPSYLSDITITHSAYPHTESKVHAYLSRNGRIFMYMETEFKPDETPPAPIVDLSAALGEKGGIVNLKWTATGDDGLDGQSARYIVKYADFAITEGNWQDAITFEQNLIPKPSGESETLEIQGLVGGKIYYFAIKAIDDAGNPSLISNVPSISMPQDIDAPVISQVLCSGVTDTEATITWQTDEPANSQVEYGLDINYGLLSGLGTDYVISHSIKITGLRLSTQYHYRVISEDGSGNKAVSGDYVFATSDFMAPIISNISTANIESYSATITWQTDEPATSQIEYGQTLSYGSKTNLDTELVISHAVTISALEPNTDYHYRVLTRDANGNEGKSGDSSFYTPPFGGKVVILQEGKDGYAGTSDTHFYFYPSLEHKNYGDSSILMMTGEGYYKGPLIKFAIFEDEGGSIPLGSKIDKATLKLYNPISENETDFNYYTVLKYWTEAEADYIDAIHPTVPWVEPGANGAGIDRGAEPEGQIFLKGLDWTSTDVTKSVQKFSNGNANEGWIFQAIHPLVNIVRAYSSEYPTNPTLRPILEISYTPPAQPKPNLNLAKSADRETVKQGDIITYTITYQNIGTGDAKNVIITDPIPQGTTYVAGSADATGGSFDGTQVVWNIGDVKAGGSGNVGFQARVE